MSKVSKNETVLSKLHFHLSNVNLDLKNMSEIKALLVVFISHKRIVRYVVLIDPFPDRLLSPSLLHSFSWLTQTLGGGRG